MLKEIILFHSCGSCYLKESKTFNPNFIPNLGVKLVIVPQRNVDQFFSRHSLGCSSAHKEIHQLWHIYRVHRISLATAIKTTSFLKEKHDNMYSC